MHNENPHDNFTQNPYAASHDLAANLRPADRPTSVTVFGALNLVFGLLGLCGVAWSGIFLYAGQSMMPANAPPNPVFELMTKNPIYAGFMAVSMILGVIFTVVLIAAGVALLRWNPLGRRLSIWYSVYAIVMGIMGMVVNTVFLYGPLLQQAGGGPATATAGMIGGIIGSAMGLIYPALLWYFMTRPHVVAALEG